MTRIGYVMNIKGILTGFALMAFLAIPCKAGDVYAAVLSYSSQEGLGPEFGTRISEQQLQSFDNLITSNAKDLKKFFSNGDFSLKKSDDEFVIMGGNKGIRSELTKYASSGVTYKKKLLLYVCREDRSGGTTKNYVVIRPYSQGTLSTFCRHEVQGADENKVFDGSGTHRISLQTVIDALEARYR
ncbi:MAG: hypothetical protein WB676_30875 [Bryobacteraceae bacterium]